MANVCAGLFAAEGLGRKGKISLDDELGFVVEDPSVWDDETRNILESIISLALGISLRVSFLKGTRHRIVARRDQLQLKPASLTLFSGGTDSLSGISAAHSGVLGPTVGVFVSHDRMSMVVDNLRSKYLNALGIKIAGTSIQRGLPGIQQFRGLVYICFAGILSRLFGTNAIVVSETGPTMYQPSYVPSDEVTITTHPALVELTKSLLKKVYGIEFTIYEPFENMTKAESLSNCPQKDAVKDTNSCITSMWANSQFSHCGKCLGCLVRRISCLVAGVSDAEYAWDVLVRGLGDPVPGRKHGLVVKAKHFDDLMALLRSSRDIIEGKLPYSVAQKIFEFGKTLVFQRFANDILAAIYLLYDVKKEGRNSYVESFYRQCLRDSVVTVDQLRARIDGVRAGVYRPDFSIRL